MQPNQTFHDIKKILIVKLKHIGDVLLATPCFRALHNAFPAAQISALVYEGTEVVLMNHPLLKEVIRFPHSSMKGGGIRRVRKEIEFVLRLRQHQFDMVVDLTSADRAAWLAWLSGARYRLAYDPGRKGFLGKRFFYTHLVPYPADPDLHEVKKNLGLFEHFGFSCLSPRLEMYLSEKDIHKAKQILSSLELLSEGPLHSSQANGFAVVHPTSRWLFKCWVDERMAALVDWLQTSGRYPVVLTCGPDPRELERSLQVLARCSTHPRTLLGKLSISEWAALVRHARVFIGVDSAPMHIAASQGIPTLAFFGPTGFQNWRPWAVPHAVLVHDCPCSRDRQPHCDWSRVRACMSAITLEEAKEALSQLLLESSGAGP